MAKIFFKTNLSCLIESSKVINSSLNLPKILNKVTLISKNILSAEAGSLMLFDKNRKYLLFSVALGKKGHKLKKEIALKIGQGIAGHVAKTGKPVIANNVNKDTRFFNLADKLSGFKTRSVMCVPLKVKNKTIGVLEAINSHRKRGFSLNDLDLFSAFACQIAVAIDNARMHEEDLQNQKLNQELSIARQIQQNLLPKIPENIDIKISAKNIPAEQVGGDLYDFIDFGHNKYGIMISDVSGKGIPAALYMVRVMEEFRSAIKIENNFSTALNIVNNALCDKAIMGMFVTLFYIVIDKTIMKAWYTSAGHPPAMYFSADNNRFELLDKAQNPPLGIMPGTKYRHAEMQLAKNSSILLYTDGVVEARNKKGEDFSEERAKQAFLKGINNDIIKEITTTLESYTESNELEDDCTLVSIKL